MYYQPSIESRVAALEDGVEALASGEVMVQSVNLFSELPSPVGLADGTLAIVRNSFMNGLPALWLVRGGLWELPYGAQRPTITFVCATSGGGTILPQVLAVGAGANGVLGTGWATAAGQTFARPANILGGGSINPAAVELGANAAGLWRIAAAITFDSPAPGSALVTSFHLQRSIGGGAFADVPNVELFRLDQDAPIVVNGVAHVGLALNLVLTSSDQLRVVVRHTDAGSRNYTIRRFAFVMEQLGAALT